MPTIILRPNATTLDPAGWVPTGFGTLHQCLNDGGTYPAGLDSTYIRNPFDFSWCKLGFPDVTGLPSTPYRISSVRIRVRGWKDAGGLNSGRATTVVGGKFDSREDDWQMATGIGAAAGYTGIVRTTQPNGKAWSKSAVNALEVALRANYAIDQSFSEVWLYVNYVNAPVVDVVFPTGTLGYSRFSGALAAAFSYTQEDGRAQTYAEIKVFTAAQVADGSFGPNTTEPVYWSGQRAGSGTSFTIGGPQSSRETIEARGGIFVSDLKPGSYYLYARAACDVNGTPLWSAWNSEAFTVSLEQPAAPVVVAQPDAPGSQVLVQLQGQDNFLPKLAADAEDADASFPTSCWVAAAGTTLARSTAQAYAGLASWRLTNTSGGTADTGLGMGTNVVGVFVPGQKYSLSCRAKIVSGSNRNVKIGVLWWSDGGLVGAEEGAAVSTGTGAWTNPTLVGAVCPAGARWGQVYVVASGMAAAQAVDLDQLSIRPGTSTTYSRGGCHNRNVLSSNQASGAGVDTSDFEVLTGGCAIARETGTKLEGASSLKVTANATAAGSMSVGTLGGLAGVQVREGATYDGSAYFRAASGAQLAYIQVNIEWFDSDGESLGFTFGQPGGDTNTGWTQVTVKDAVAPIGARYARLIVWLSNLYNSEVHYVDNLSLGMATGTAFTPWIPGEAHQGFTSARYSDDDGQTWSYVRYGQEVVRDATQKLHLHDRECPPGDLRRYVGVSVVDPEGVAVPSPDSVAAVATLDTKVWWLKDPLFPDLSIARNEGFLVNDTDDEVDERAGIYEVLGDPYPVVISDAVGGRDGSLKITSIGREEWRKLRKLLEAPRTLLLVDPIEREQRYIRFVGKRSWSKRMTSMGPMRSVKADFREVARP